MRVLIVGLGVSGMTTALQLLREGHTVEIWFRARGMAPPVALWECPPYKVEPEKEAAEWSMETLRVLCGMLPNKETGVYLLPCVYVSTSKIDPNPYGDQLIDYCHSPAILNRPEFSEIPRGKYIDAQMYMAPHIDTKLYLKWLQQQLKALGCKFVQRKLALLTDLALEAQENNFDVVINCTGLGARDFVPDETVFPCKGEVVHVRAPTVRFSLDDGEGQYMIPNLVDGTVELGGTGENDVWDKRINPQNTNRILTRSKETLVPASLKDAQVVDNWAGLRPKRRDGIRLELDTQQCLPVVHNYGHGGGGISCSWGCAKEVAKIVSRLSPQSKL